MEEELGRNNLEKLKERLYRKREKFKDREERARIYGERPTTPPYWHLPEEKEIFMPPPPKKRSRIFLFIIIIFVLILIGLAVYFFFSETNIISSKNVDIEIKGPTYGEAGKILSFNIFVENKNKTALELAELIFDFPEDSFFPDARSLDRVRFPLDKINANAMINKPIEVVFFGQENEDKKFSVTLEYRLADSNAIFAKSQDFIFKISSPPVGLSISLPKEINSRQELNIKVETVSNSESIIKNLSLQMNYPTGFQFLGADPKPTRGNNTWLLGDLGSLQKREITIKGFIEGQDLENKSFNAIVGVSDENGVLKPYGSTNELVIIKKSPLYLSLFINGKDLEKNVARPGSTIKGEIQWFNNLSTNVREAKIELELKGEVIDERSIKKLIWNSSSLAELSSIAPGQSGKAQFSFSLKESLPISSASSKNFLVVLEAKISALAISEQAENFEVITDLKKEIRVSSLLQLTAIALYYSSPLKNSGPLPPKVNQETTYTILWSLGFNSSDFSKVKVVAFLPPYVRWLNSFFPSDSRIKFNERDNTVTWEAGDVLAGTGIISSAKEVAFQVGLTPNLNQINLSPPLISEAKLEGYDNFTEEVLNSRVSSLTTELNYDEKFKSNEGRVIE